MPKKKSRKSSKKIKNNPIVFAHNLRRGAGAGAHEKEKIEYEPFIYLDEEEFEDDD